MHIDKVIAVNWGNLPSNIYSIGDIHLLVGATGVGKSTLIDAIQVSMTACRDGLYKFNPAQNEASQKSRDKKVRTLASYCLGCDQGPYARPDGCDSYIAILWSPDEGERGKKFTSIIAMRSYLEINGKLRIAQLKKKMHYLVPGKHLVYKDFVTTKKSDVLVENINNFFNHLRVKYGKSSISEHEGPENYLCQLYGLLRGLERSVSKEEAKHSAKMFSSFISYRPTDNLNKFIRQDVLENKDKSEKLRSVSTMLKEIQALKKEADHMTAGAEALSSAILKINRFIELWKDKHLYEYVRASQNLNYYKTKRTKFVKENNTLSNEVIQLRKKIEDYDIALKKLGEREVEIKVLIKSSDVGNKKDRLEEDLKLARDKKDEAEEVFMSEYTLFLSLEQSTLSLETSLLQKDIFQLLTINQTIVQDNRCEKSVKT